MMKVSKDRLVFWPGRFTIEIYWPNIIWVSGNYGVQAPTLALVKVANEYSKWMLSWSFVIRLAGFGVGLAKDHCLNPNIEEEPTP